MQSEEGNKYLENCWRMEQINPDRKGIRAKMEKQ
jgi:hypothetical protein